MFITLTDFATPVSLLNQMKEDIKQPCFSLCLVWEVAIQLVTHHHVEDTYATAELENHK